MAVLPVVLTTLNRGTQSVIPYIEEMVEAIGATGFEIVTEGVSIFSGGVNRPRRVRFLKSVHGTLQRGEFFNLEFNFLFIMFIWNPESAKHLTARFINEDSMFCFLEKKNGGEFGNLGNLPDNFEELELESDEFPIEGFFDLEATIQTKDEMNC